MGLRHIDFDKLEKKLEEEKTVLPYLTKVPQIIEDALYLELEPEKPYDVLLNDGQKKERFAFNGFIYCPDTMHQRLLPLTVKIKKGIKKANLIVPYKDAEYEESIGEITYKAYGLEQLHEYMKKNEVIEKSEEFLAVIQMKVKNAVLSATHFENIPNWVFDLKTNQIVKTEEIIKVHKIRDPIFELESGRYYGRVTDITLPDFAGTLNIYEIRNVKLIPKKERVNLKR